MNADPGSGRSISYEVHFNLAIIQMVTGRKIADSPVLRDKAGISLGALTHSLFDMPIQLIVQ